MAYQSIDVLMDINRFCINKITAVGLHNLVATETCRHGAGPVAHRRCFTNVQ